MTNRYSMVLEWSDEDQAFIVSLPEFGPHAHSHGETREEALRMGCDALESLLDAYKAEGKPLPRPRKFEHAGKKKQPKKVRA